MVFRLKENKTSLQISGRRTKTEQTFRGNDIGEGKGGKAEKKGSIKGPPYRDGGIDSLNVALLDEDLHGLEA